MAITIDKLQCILLVFFLEIFYNRYKKNCHPIIEGWLLKTIRELLAYQLLNKQDN